MHRQTSTTGTADGGTTRRPGPADGRTARRPGTMSRPRQNRHRLGTALALLALGATTLAGLPVSTASPAQAAPAPIRLTSSSCPAVVAPGQQGGCVAELQRLLDLHGAGLQVDGDFGPATSRAVRTFQAEVAIAVDGLVGSATKAKLYAVSTTTSPVYDLRAPACPATIRQGQRGGCVVTLQRLLVHRGYLTDVDGDFGPGTVSSVRAFQAALGLTVDGVVGPSTKAALYNTDESPASALDLRSSACPSVLREGQAGGCVRTLQALLAGTGRSITVDGAFGPATTTAVRAFQTSARLTVDGQVGPVTKTALYATLAGTATGSTPTTTTGSTGSTPSAGAPAPLRLTSSSCPTYVKQGQISGCVTELQSLLNQHGADLAVDGDFGPLTYQAVLTFQASAGLSQDGIVGPVTKSALYSATSTGPTPPAGGGHASILPVAEAELGVVEGSARADSYGQAVGLSASTSGYAWCAVFVSWVAMRTGATAYRDTRVLGWVTQARAGRYNLSVTTDPQPGDIVAFDWDGGSNFNSGNEHIGIVRTVSGTTFTTVEGNTSNPNGSNDGVYSKTRGTGRGYDVVFIRVR